MTKLSTNLDRHLIAAAKVALVACFLGICYLAFKPAGGGQPLMPWDKAEHFTAFFVLTGLCVAALPRVSLVWIAVTILSFGALIEVIQGLPFVKRDCDFWDWVADATALFAVYAIILAVKVRNAGDGIDP